MKRNVSLEEISDGRLYGENDMVKADCHGCKGCSKCCHGMGESIVLDPYDIYRLQVGEGLGFSELLSSGKIELNVVDGVILPNLRMVENVQMRDGQGTVGKMRTPQCAFLDATSRCSIHKSRPGICRLFPLGRYYENGDFKYFLQTGECAETNRSKVKVSKWIDTPNLRSYHNFLCTWHYFLNDVEEKVGSLEDMEAGKRLNMLMLQTFYMVPYEVGEDFYTQFATRMNGFSKK